MKKRNRSKSELELLMEEMEAEGKITKIDPKVTAKIKNNIRGALDDYRAKTQLKRFESEQELNRTILNI